MSPATECGAAQRLYCFLIYAERYTRYRGIYTGRSVMRKYLQRGYESRVTSQAPMGYGRNMLPYPMHFFFL